MVVAGYRQYPSVAGGAEGIGMLDDVHAAVNARPLAIPHAEDAIVFCALEKRGLLTAPDSSGGEILVDARLEQDIVPFEIGGRFPHGLIHATQRRSPVSRDKAGGVESGPVVALTLQHG